MAPLATPALAALVIALLSLFSAADPMNLPPQSALDEPTSTPAPDDSAWLNAIYHFDESLAIVGPLSPLHDDETAALAEALEAYQQATSNEAVEGFETFLSDYPESAWRVTLLTNLGLIYRRTGYYSRALTSWEIAWDEAWSAMLELDSSDPTADVQRVANRTVGELAQLYTRLGRYEELDLLLSELDTSALGGYGYNAIEAAQEGFHHMTYQPETSFRCGPYALSRLLAFWYPDESPFPPEIRNSQSTYNGFSLAEVSEISETLNMGLVPGYRSAGAEIVIPAVVHWRSDHYAAILEELVAEVDEEVQETTTFYRVEDPTFGEARWLSRQAIDDESSGYFLIPEGSAPEGWTLLDNGQVTGIYGKGYAADTDRSETKEESLKSQKHLRV